MQEAKITKEDAVQVIDTLRKDWTRYFVDVLGEPEEFVWDKMREIITALQAHRRVAVKAGNSVSKTFTAAGLANCFNDIYGPNSSVITTAPTSKHLEDVLWGEIKNQRINAKVPLGGEITQLNISRKNHPKWIFTGLTVRPDNITQQAAALQGYHNEWVLIIFDEASGIPPQIWAAAERLMTNERCFWLVIGNPPINGLGEFVDCFKPDSGWHQITISVLDTPNFKEGKEIIPGVAGRLFEEEQAIHYGRTSARYMANVLGEIPFATEGTVFGEFVGGAMRAGRITHIPHEFGAKVHTFRDIGSMHTAVIYAQFIGREIRIIDYYEDHNGLGVKEHIGVHNTKAQAGYTYGEHFTGWDIAKSGPNAKQNGQYVLDLYAGLNVNLQTVSKEYLLISIEQVRDIFPQIYIDREKCADLIAALRHYKLRKIEKGSVEGKPVYSTEEEKNWATHGIAALRCLAQAYKTMYIDGRLLGDTAAREREFAGIADKSNNEWDYDPLGRTN